ncbi:unnamed protein product [Parascedosporium putredinis]|uniref:Uncharacterized protein n=1 Tax=Parascedosporium putredinis TaxID=1442378 RepID=A0A9P1GZX5_9PEZI|nr:unnamed protein product [Parascedosporium putredinis]CAI7992268.1 unnamed protein product [Parascedosporium putredinis]
MAIKHNQKLISTHLRKDWQRRVRTHFDQPGGKVRRRDARRAKAAAVAPVLPTFSDPSSDALPSSTTAVSGPAVASPLRSSRVKKGDSKTDLSKVETVTSISAALPIAVADKTIKEIKRSDLPAAIEGGAYRKLRLARSDARLAGVREKRIRDKAEAEAAKK